MDQLLNLNKLKNKKINLASLLDGASVIACNNEHFGKAENILAPGKAKNMGDGWETRRRRGKGFDWLILNSLNGKEIDKIEISTHHFKGNFPSSLFFTSCYIYHLQKTPKQIVNSSVKWKYLLKDAKLSANKIHTFKNNLMKKDKINFIKINIFPDGGISRFRIYGNECMTDLIIKPKVITKENFKKFGDMITTDWHKAFRNKRWLCKTF